MHEHEKINYLEFAARDFDSTRVFFSTVFDWSFTEYGEDYLAFENAGVSGGFYRADKHNSTESGGALVVFYSNALEATQNKIEAAGGIISVPIFSFPGGRRFHFIEPSGNEFAVWSDK